MMFESGTISGTFRDAVRRWVPGLEITGIRGVAFVLAGVIFIALPVYGLEQDEAVRRLGDGALPAKRAVSGTTDMESMRSATSPDSLKARRLAIEKKTGELYRKAEEAYSIGEYTYCVGLCDQILRIYPNHDDARRLRYNANVKRFRREASYRDQEHLLDTERAAVPPKKLLPLKRQPVMRSDVIKKYDTEGMRAMEAALDEKVTISFSDADLEYVLNVLFKLNNINIIVDNNVLKDEKITILVKDMPLRDVLKFIARNKPNLGYTVTENAIWFHTPQSPIMEPRVYPIQFGLMEPGKGGSSVSSGTSSGSRSSSSGSSGGIGSRALSDYQQPSYPNVLGRNMFAPGDGVPLDNGGGAGVVPTGLTPEQIQEMIKKYQAGAATPPRPSGGGSATPGAPSSGGGSTGSGGGLHTGDTYLERALDFMKTWKNDWPDGTQWMIDRASNQLLVYTTPEFHKKVEQMLDIIDQPVPQVLIKTRFIEIKLNDSYAAGLSTFQGHDVDGNGAIIFGNVATDSSGNRTVTPGFNLGQGIANIAGLATGGGTFAVTGRSTDPEFQLQLRLIAGDTRARILSAPQIIAVNNQSADIFIGSKIQYVSSYREVTTTTTTTGSQSTQVSALVPDKFEDLDLGFKLNVTPSIGRDMKTIVLTLNPEITDLSPGQTLNDFRDAPIIIGTGSGGGNMVVKRPTTDERRLTTKVTIQDNGYVVIGGLIRNRQEEVENRVPFLSRIPIFGFLFKSRTRVNDRSNLIIIVEAKIISPSGRGMTDDPDAPETDAAAKKLEEDMLMKLDVFGEVNDLRSPIPDSIR